MKEEDYVMMMMTNYETNERAGRDKLWTIDGYPETVHRHYQHRDSVEYHNTRYQSTIELEETWYTSL